MSKISHIELHVDDTERAAAFYSNVFGWIVSPKSTGSEEYWMLLAGPEGIAGGIRPRMKPGVAAVPQIAVDSLGEAAAKVIEHGGKMLGAKKKIPGTGVLQYCQDTEGNLFALLEKSYEVKE